jgi:hypothetical protein
VFYRNNIKDDVRLEEDAGLGNFNEILQVPHISELVLFYEKFFLLHYPKEPILMMKRKCKTSSLTLSFHSRV